MLKNIYALSDIFVFPSKIESQGLVIVEAMLCGIPVVAIGEMGVKEVMKGDNGGYMVKDDVDHFVFSPFDHEAGVDLSRFHRQIEAGKAFF